MKHAIITLIVVFLFVLIVVPLIYIVLGKMKNPIDIFASNAVSKSGALTQQSNFISPNYIPASGGSSDTQKGTNQYAKVREDALFCFSDEQLLLVSEEAFALEKAEGQKFNIKNDKTGTTRFFEGYRPEAKTKAAIASLWNTVEVKTVTFRPGCAKNGSTASALLAEYNDGNVYLTLALEQNPGYLDSYDITQRGLTTINGLPYYWHMAEDKNRIYREKEDTQYYMLFYSTLYNNKIYITMYNGTSDLFGSTRDFLNQTQAFLSGTVYGTSTPGMAPNADPNTTKYNTVPNDGRTQTPGTGGQNNTNTQPSNKAPSNYVPWTPAV